jgi:hypothetical protein
VVYVFFEEEENHFRGTEPTSSTFRVKLYELQNGGGKFFPFQILCFGQSLRNCNLLIYHNTAFNMHTVKTTIFRLDFLKHTQGMSNFSVVVTKYTDGRSSSHSCGAQRKAKKFYISRIII